VSLPQDILSNLRGFTRAMYSTWFYYSPAGVLFDAGEGAGSFLANTVFGIRKVFLSHGHYDHIGGLPGIVLARNSAMGEKTLPLKVYFPAGDPYVQLQREYIRHLSRGLQYELSWEDLSPGRSVPLEAASGKWSVETFSTEHVRSQTTLGYRLVEERRRLRPEFRGKTEDEIREIARARGREGVSENYRHTLLAYTGDATAVDPSEVRGAELLLHDATFITPEEREAKIHATLEEALTAARDAEVASLGLIHISSRYKVREIERLVREAVAAMGISFPVAVFHNARVLPIS
jgi:ribonuclease Z